MFLVKYEINYQRVTVIKTIVLLYIRYKVMYVNNFQNGYVFVICCNYHRAFTFYSKVYLKDLMSAIVDLIGTKPILRYKITYHSYLGRLADLISTKCTKLYLIILRYKVRYHNNF